ncbi:MAG TPA: tetratricopeptide repeat protein [Steroidobacteraceae bacterium]|nr:tetratricopeptide repeat protein [Steroidobacteraceae bacterium]
MTAFLIIAVFMAAIAATAVAWPLLRKRESRLVGAAAGLLVMAAAAGLYPLWSNWNWQEAPAPAPAASPQVLAMVAELERKMQAAPNDIKGWLLLGRSDIALERVDDAVTAFQQAHRLDADNVEALLGLGEALSMRAGGNITPSAGQLFERAVSLQPDDPRALLYSGFAAATRGDRAAARTRWLALKALNPPPEIDAMLDQRIAELGTADLAAAGGAPGATGAGSGSAGGMPGLAAAATPAVAGQGAAAQSGAQATVNLSISPALKARLTADTPLFVFAREPGMQGPPLAAKRLTSAAIGTQIHLSAADSMVPGRVLTSGQKVSITARVSFSGQPLPAAGDLYGELTYDIGHDGVRDLVIDQVTQ